uniref:Uncharacterized protein n=1 Tax=Cacopsylla melanoneura TaxID=428564 RepID=A0A8D9EL43_9HEMI
MKMLDVLTKNTSLFDAAATFLNRDATHEDIASAGNKCLVVLYGGGEDDSVHALRYLTFVRSAASAKVHLARLPPTEEADAQHSDRTFHQVQKWLGVNLEPTNWGWKSSHQGLIPVMSTKEPAPLTLLMQLQERLHRKKLHVPESRAETFCPLQVLIGEDVQLSTVVDHG